MTLKNDRYTYRVTWSEDDKEYVGLCAEFASLSWLARTPEGALKGSREVYFTKPGKGFYKTEIYDYDRLRPGNRVKGPSVIETRITTIVIPPERVAKVDEYLNVEILI